MQWVKAFHIIFMVTWFAGLFYLPRLFVYHALARDEEGYVRFIVMERKLFAIMSIGAVLTVAFGLWLWLGFGVSGNWLYVKLVLVAVLAAYHLYCAKLMTDFKYRRNRHGAAFYRWINELPALLLIAIVILAVVRPF